MLTDLELVEIALRAVSVRELRLVGGGVVSLRVAHILGQVADEIKALREARETKK